MGFSLWCNGGDGVPVGFNNLVALLFKDALASVKVNSVLSKSFMIEHSMRQGSLAPFLFIIATKVLNTMVVLEATAGRLKGIRLLVENRQQLMAQYANDTSFILIGEEEPTLNLIYFMDIFCLASRLVIH